MSAIKLKRKERRIGPARVCLYAKMGCLVEEQKMARHYGKNLGAKTICSVVSQGDARHSITEHKTGEVLYADGIILRQAGEGVIFSSRECPIVTIINQKTGEVGSVYVGEQSLMTASTDCASCSTGVLEKLFAVMGIPNGKDVSVYVAGGTSARHCTHRNQAELLPFIEKFGESVVLDRSRGILNIFQVIVKICRGYGVLDNNISFDGLCINTTPLLGDTISNWIYVIKSR